MIVMNEVGQRDTAEGREGVVLARRRDLHERSPMPNRRHGDDAKARTQHAERRFAINGEGWAVWEDRRTLNGPSLVFENNKVARRVHQYPANWRELSDEELWALSWSR